MIYSVLVKVLSDRALILYLHRYLKKVFQDLFVGHGYQNDGVYDWDLFRRAQRVGKKH